MEDETVNPFANGDNVPDAGGYNVFAIMDDGGTLCYRCIIDPTNPVEDIRTTRSAYGASGWGIAAFTYDGAEDGPVYCDHCNATIVEDWRVFDETCSTCGTKVRKVVERYATYWEDESYDSLSYSPTLHDHRP